MEDSVLRGFKASSVPRSDVLPAREKPAHAEARRKTEARRTKIQFSAPPRELLLRLRLTTRPCLRDLFPRCGLPARCSLGVLHDPRPRLRLCLLYDLARG